MRALADAVIGSHSKSGEHIRQHRPVADRGKQQLRRLVSGTRIEDQPNAQRDASHETDHRMHNNVDEPSAQSWSEPHTHELARNASVTSKCWRLENGRAGWWWHRRLSCPLFSFSAGGGPQFFFGPPPNPFFSPFRSPFRRHPAGPPPPPCSPLFCPLCK